MKKNFWNKLLDIIAPRTCVICGKRLSIQENSICAVCNRHLPRTKYIDTPYDNEMTKLFWGQIPIERCAALFFYEGHSQVCNILYELKYHNHPEIGQIMGRMVSKEFHKKGFFDDIDTIIPIPLAKKRLHQRGYNQSMEIAKGIQDITGLSITDKAIKRKTFSGSQTQKDRWSRMDNVSNVFELTNKKKIANKHILIIDDVVTTGATIISCANEMKKAGNIKISVLSLGFAKS